MRDKVPSSYAGVRAAQLDRYGELRTCRTTSKACRRELPAQLRREGQEARLLDVPDSRSAGRREGGINAVQLIREDQKLAGVLNERADPPMIYCEGIEQSEPLDPASVVQLGFTFYPEEAES